MKTRTIQISTGVGIAVAGLAVALVFSAPTQQGAATETLSSAAAAGHQNAAANVGGHVFTYLPQSPTALVLNAAPCYPSGSTPLPETVAVCFASQNTSPTATAGDNNAVLVYATFQNAASSGPSSGLLAPRDSTATTADIGGRTARVVATTGVPFVNIFWTAANGTSMHLRTSNVSAADALSIARGIQ